jgi:hypothetical protein
MALTASFQRNPINHGDFNVWLPIIMQQILRGGIGGNNIDVSNVGGSLTVGLGYAGINDGVVEGTMQVTIAGSVTLAGSTAGVWHAFEFSVSGTAVTFSLAALAGETDESFMSLTMKGYYDAAKCGYYRIASRRTLAFVFIRAGTVLGRIVNTENGVKGFKGITVVDYIDSLGAQSKKYITSKIIAIGNWNMRAAGGGSLAVNVPHGLGSMAHIISVNGFVIDDSNSYKSPIVGGETYLGNPPTSASAMDIRIADIDNLNIILMRTTGSVYDSVNFDSTPFDRGALEIKYET